MRKTKIFCVVLTVSRPPLHGRDLWCVQYKLLRSDIEDCCCFQTLKISSFKKNKTYISLLVYHKDGESGGYQGFVVYPPDENCGTMLPATPHHLLQRSLEPYGAEASCLVHGDNHQLGQAAWLIPSTDGDCLLSNHELSPLLLLFFPHWQNQSQRICSLQRNAEDINL